MKLLISDVVNLAEKQLKESGIANAKGEAEMIYCHMKKIDRVKFFQRWSKPADDGEMESYFSIVERRCKREPLQLIMGETEFMGYPFKVRKNVLIPRMDTEAVVSEAAKLLGHKNKILDLCCGSGIIGITLYKLGENEKKSVKLTSVDISDDALALTAENAQLNHVKPDILKSNLFDNKKIKTFDMIVSNPPYIKRDVIPTLDAEVKNYDPVLALDGGTDGLEFYRRIVELAPNHLKKKGYLLFEIGCDQGISVAEMLKSSGNFTDIEITKDLSGRDRVVKGMCEK